MTQHGMTAEEMADRVLSVCPGTVDLRAGDDHFLVHDPTGDLRPELQQPFATVVTTDAYDRASDLDRPGVRRLNAGLPRATYEELFGRPRDDDRRYDLTALDQLMPHPVHAGRYWVCVLNPSAARMPVVDGLVRRAHELAVREHTNRTARRS